MNKQTPNSEQQLIYSQSQSHSLVIIITIIVVKSSPAQSRHDDNDSNFETLKQHHQSGPSCRSLGRQMSLSFCCWCWSLLTSWRSCSSSGPWLFQWWSCPRLHPRMWCELRFAWSVKQAGRRPTTNYDSKWNVNKYHILSYLIIRLSIKLYYIISYNIIISYSYNII